MNEYVNCIVLYHLICFTAFLYDPEIQFELGWSLILVQVLLFLVGFTVVILD